MNRKRTMQLATFLGTLINANTAFVVQRSSVQSRIQHREAPLFAASKEKVGAHRHGWLQTKKHLPQEEQNELLRFAVEHRRIKKIETELRLTKRTLTSLQLSRAAGYGDDLISMEEAITDGENAREQLVTTNMGLVNYCVNDIVQTKKLQSVQFDDLLQEGAIGLSRAVDRWNPQIGGRFSSYATYWIRAAIFRAIAEKDDLMKVPEHVNGIISKLHKTQWKEYETAKQLAEAAGISDRQLELALKVKKQRNMGVLSFESWMQQGQNFETDLQVSDETKLDESEIKDTLSKFLRPKEVEALSWRYGLNQLDKQFTSGKQGEAMSFKDVGKRMQISAEYGRKLCGKALEKLQQAAADGVLEPALLGC